MESVRERAIMCLLSERTLGAAAKTAGVAERTLRRWLTDDDAFKASLAEARRTAFEAGLSRVQAIAAKAIDTLEDLLRKGEQPSVRLGAARAVVELAVSRHDAETLLTRLEELEQRVEQGRQV